jgi:hypothetical protein
MYGCTQYSEAGLFDALAAAGVESYASDDVAPLGHAQGLGDAAPIAALPSVPWGVAVPLTTPRRAATARRILRPDGQDADGATPSYHFRCDLTRRLLPGFSKPFLEPR